MAEYKFLHRSNDGSAYFWEKRTAGDSRVGIVWCPVDWFWREADRV